ATPLTSPRVRPTRSPSDRPPVRAIAAAAEAAESPCTVTWFFEAGDDCAAATSEGATNEAARTGAAGEVVAPTVARSAAAPSASAIRFRPDLREPAVEVRACAPMVPP